MQEHKKWFVFAESDLRSAKIMLQAEDYLVIGSILYHCQQSIEKS